MQTIGRRRLQEMLRDGVQLVEVLPEREFSDEHIEGAINIPLKRLDAAAVEELDRGRPVVVYCNSCT